MSGIMKVIEGQDIGKDLGSFFLLISNFIRK
jgi:hypothetical protein